MCDFIEIPVKRDSIKQRKPIYGVGINDADYKVQPTINGKKIMCPYYKVWTSMLSRCYNPKVQARQSSYKGCYVSTAWLSFSNFKSWMEMQDWQGKQLDKDILLIDNKVYSEETCIFVSHSINSLLTNHASKRGKYPQGVYFYKPKNKFKSQCRVNGKVKHLGYFDTVKEAEYCYATFKRKHIIDIANNQSNIRLRVGLVRQADSFMEKFSG